MFTSVLICFLMSMIEAILSVNEATARFVLRLDLTVE